MTQEQFDRLTRRQALIALGALPALSLTACGGGGAGGGSGEGPAPEPGMNRTELARFAADGGTLEIAAGDYTLLSGHLQPAPPGTPPSSTPVNNGQRIHWRCLGEAKAENLQPLGDTAGIQGWAIAANGAVYGLFKGADASRDALILWAANGSRTALTAFTGSGLAGCGPRLLGDDWIASDQSALHLPSRQTWQLPASLFTADGQIDVHYGSQGAESVAWTPSRTFTLVQDKPVFVVTGVPGRGALPARLYAHDLQSGQAQVLAQHAELHQAWPQTDGQRLAWVQSTTLTPPGGRDHFMFDLRVAPLGDPNAARLVASQAGAFALAGGTLAWQEGLSVAAQGGATSPFASAIWVDDGSAGGLRLAQGLDLELAGAGHGAVVWRMGSARTPESAPQGTWLWTRSGGTRKVSNKSVFFPVILPGRLYFCDGHSYEQRVVYRVDFQA